MKLFIKGKLSITESTTPMGQSSSQMVPTTKEKLEEVSSKERAFTFSLIKGTVMKGNGLLVCQKDRVWKYPLAELIREILLKARSGEREHLNLMTIQFSQAISRTT